MRRRLRQAGLVAAAVLVALEVVYLAAVNVFLNTSMAPEAINRNPAKFEIRWRSGWSFWPGMAVLHGVETRGRSRVIAWDARLDSVSARFRLRPLRRRTVDLKDVVASGVVYRQRRLVPGPALERVPAEELPPVLMTLDPSAPPPVPKPPPVNRGTHPWTVRADRIACDLD